MSEDYGIQPPGQHRQTTHQPPARYLVVIDFGGVSIARLFDASRVQVARFDGGSEEVAVMAKGLQPARSGAATEWDAALEGHSHAERENAELYTLDV